MESVAKYKTPIYLRHIMANKDTIVTLPHGRLRQRSKRVGIITDDIQQIVADMEAATLDWEQNRKHELGVALAAVQIDELLRIVIVRFNLEDKSDTRFDHFINPEITKRSGKLVDDYEGCLSVPDIYGKVPRYERIKLKALDLEGKPLRLSADGFLARVLQHEVDHTNGLLFIDHIKDVPGAFFHLSDKGHLEELDYEKDVRDNSILW